MLPPPSPEDRQRVTAANSPGWKVGLALVSLALSLLLWLNGLIDSLSRPSVGNALNRRQLELTVLAQPSQLSSLVRLALDARAARATLTRLRSRIGSGFGLHDLADAMFTPAE